MRVIRALTEVNVPRRIDWRVMIPNQISIWFNHELPTRGEVERDVRVVRQPGLDLRGGVRGQVVQHYVDVLAGVGFDGLT